MALTLSLNGQVVDLPPQTEVALSYQACDLADFATRESDFSETFTLPLTNRNARVLGTPHALDTDSTAPYQLLPALLSYNDVPVLDGMALLESAEEGYAVTLTSKTGALFALVGERKLRELDMSAFDHQLRYDAVRLSQTRDYRQGYTYPWANTGKLTQDLNPIQIRTPLPFDWLPHATYVHAVLTRIITEALPGYAVEGSALNEPRYQRLVFPQGTNTPRMRPAYTEQFSASARKTSDQTSAAPSRGFVDPVIVFQDAEDPGSRLEQSGGATIYKAPGFVADVTVRMVMYLTIDAPALVVGPGNNPQVILRVVDEGPNGGPGFGVVYQEELIITKEWQSIPPFGLPVLRRTVEAEYTLPRAWPNNRLFVQLLLRDGMRVKVGTGSRVSFSVGPNSYRNAPVHLEQSLPDISQAEFLKFLANTFGALYQTDPARQVVRLDLFNDVRANRSRARDWSGKIDLTRRPRLRYRIGQHAQRNTFRHADPPDAYEVLGIPNPTGEGSLPVPDATLPMSHEAYTSPVALTQVAPALYWSTEAVLLPFYKWKSEVFANAALWQPGIAYTNDDALSPFYEYYGGRYWRVRDQNGEGGGGSTVPAGSPPPTPGNTNWVPFDESEVFDSLTDELPTVALLAPVTSYPPGIVFGNDSNSSTFLPTRALTAEGLRFEQDLLPAYYGVQQQLLERLRLVEVDVRLNAVDIDRLDFTEPVKIDVPHWPGYGSLQGYFYLNLIDQYQLGQGATPCQLLVLDTSVEVPDLAVTEDVVVRVTEDGAAYLNMDDTVQPQ